MRKKLALGFILVAASTQSLAHAEDAKEVTNYVKPSDGAAYLTELSGLTLLYSFKADELAMLEKVRPGVTKTYKMAQEASARAVRSEIAEKELQKKLPHLSKFEAAQYKALKLRTEFWKRESGVWNKKADEEIAAVAKKLGSMKSHPLHDKFLRARLYNGWIRPVGAGLLVLDYARRLTRLGGESNAAVTTSLEKKSESNTSAEEEAKGVRHLLVE